jgi:DNA-binding MarR family transcriptional regulator
MTSLTKSAARIAAVANDGPRLDPERHAAFMIVALANKISASASRAYTRRFGVGVMEWRVLALVAREPGVTAHQICQVSGVDKSSVSRAAHSLIRRGDLVATEDPADNRRSFLSLTAQGHGLHDRIIAASLERDELLLAGFSAADRRLLFGFLKRLTANQMLHHAEGNET